MGNKGFAKGEFTYTVPLVISTIDNSTGSYAGGLDVSISGSGFGEDSVLSFCGMPCDITERSNTLLKCKHPALTTSYSKS